MIKRILNSRLPLIVYNPLMAFDLAYFKECWRAGGLPVLDTEFLGYDRAVEILRLLAKEEFLFGVRLSVSDLKLQEYLKKNPTANLDLAVFSYGDPEELDRFSFTGTDYRFFIETLDIELADALTRISPNGLILKGNEAPGRVSKYTGFILMQWYLANTDFPVFMHGGVGLHTAAGMFAAGVCGVVLDDQLYLTKEAPLSENFKALIGKLDENDSTVIGESLNRQYRFFAKLGTKIVKTLKKTESDLADTPGADERLYEEIAKEIATLSDATASALQSLFYLGQDGIFAKHFMTTAASDSLVDVVAAFFESVRGHLIDVDGHDPMRENSGLAKEHGTRLPLMQGPMANVSDNADFAQQVFENGGLPFFAMGSLPPDLSAKILDEGTAKVPRFGAGLIGIEALNPGVAEHLAQVKERKVPFALFAAGMPSQVKELEAAGTRTYLHTPSPGMLENAMDNGCSRFIFEGTEAGGHVGNLTSLVLWEMGVERLLAQEDTALKGQCAIFAGGLATGSGSCFISGMGATLAKRGANVGIQIGSAYLFTREVVETGAIKKLYQDLVTKERKTIVIGNTVGLMSRTIVTPFSQKMIKNEYSRISEGMGLNDRKIAFEKENVGALLIAAKAFRPIFSREKGLSFQHFDDDGQLNGGNFMVGDALAFDNEQTTIAEVNDRYFGAKKLLVDNLNGLEIFSAADGSINDEIAVVGMGCIYPDAPNTAALWENIVAKKISIGELSKERFDTDLYYSEDRKAEDRSYTKIAGHIPDYVFGGEKLGYTGEKAARLSRSQQMVLESAYQAVADAGFLEEDGKILAKMRRKTAVIVATCLGNEMGNNLHLKYYLPELKHHLGQMEEFNALDEAGQAAVEKSLAEGICGCNGYEPVHGVTVNIEASRIAFHMGIEGVNYVVDAACATSFTALDCGIKELLGGNHDAVIVGGLNTNLSPEPFVGFSKMGALSAKGSYPFDDRADGFVIGEGAGVFVLKRMKDALSDGDRIHGVIKGVGGSSDGKGKAIAAPNAKGQALALTRCYDNIRSKDVTFSDIDYIEAHGTSTTMGDKTELETIKGVYKSDSPIGISSIKSQIGHLLGGSGAAGLMKALLALKHKTLPPNGAFEKLGKNHDLAGTPLYIIEDAAEWKKEDGKPRRAAVSSYGFGGINYHCVAEEYTEGYRPLSRSIWSDLSYDFNDDRIVIAGLGVVLPGAKNAGEFWDKLVSGESATSKVPEERLHIAAYAAEEEQSHFRLPNIRAGIVTDYKFNNAKYRIPPFTAKSVDRAQLFSLDAASQAIEQAKLLPAMTAGNRIGVILGTIPGEEHVENILRTRTGLVERSVREASGVDSDKSAKVAEKLGAILRERYTVNTEDTIPGLLSNIVAGRIANFFGCNGANFVVDASCASSAIATDLAVKGLKAKDFDYVITGGVDANFYPGVLLAFKRLGLLSEEECRFFDEKASGYIMGEGAAVQVVTTYKKAVENGMPVLAEIDTCSFSSSVPAHLLSPSESVYTRAMKNAYGKSSVTPAQVDHLDVFGASNFFLDTIEKQAVEATFKKEIFFGNVKPQFGYFKAANPAVALTKLALMAQHRKILPNNHYSGGTTIVRGASVLKANDRLLDVSGRSVHLASNVNGIGGNHGHTILKTLPAFLSPAEKASGTQIPAAKTASAALEAPGKAAAAVAVPAAAKPARPAKRRAAQLQMLPPDKSGERQKIVALLSGQGAQHPGMLKELYEGNTIVRELLDRGERIFREERGYSLLDIMFGDTPALNDTDNTQPAVFLASAALFSVLQRKGFAPDIFIGHSIGEYTALFCAGILGFEPALKLILKRSQYMREAADAIPSRIMVVFKNAKECETLIRQSGLGNIYVANKNSENQTAVSGGKDEIDAFCKFLGEKGVMNRKLALSGAFHTPLFQQAADRLKAYIEGVYFNNVDYGRIISNVTGKPYPNDVNAVKELLVTQIVSPVEFIKSIEGVYDHGKTHYIELGPGKLLINLLKSINIVSYAGVPAIDGKVNQAGSVARLEDYLESHNRLFTAPTAVATAPAAAKAEEGSPAFPFGYRHEKDDNFETFKSRNDELIDKLLYEEFRKNQKQAALEAFEKFNFHTEKVTISGVSIGLPGKGHRVFSPDNFDKILAGTNCIEPLSMKEKEKITDKNITRLFKQPDGNAKFVQITSTEDVIQLAGQLGYFNLTDEYGIKAQYDSAMALAVAAGVEALKDAHIPLVMQYKETSTGAMIPDGFALPEEMQDTTGVIVTSVFPNTETMVDEMNKYYYNKFYVKPYEEFETIYYHLMANVTSAEVKEQITEWFFKIKERRKEYSTYNFDRNFAARLCPLGSAHLAQLIKARGPNILLSGACASTTQAMGVAEDWIRVGRCERVVVIGGDNATSENQNQWIGSGFLALGAATVKKEVSEAAKPFDEARNGTILGAGAVSLVLEREDKVRERGLNGQAEVLGTYLGNSAYHTFNIDVKHLAREMSSFVGRVEKKHGLTKSEYAKELLFMSHETYTPARGGSADAEVNALKGSFPDNYGEVAITNTKGYTGHTLGAAIEDAVLVKAMQRGMAPPIANLKNPSPHFADLNLKREPHGNYRYGIHLAAGFGSHFAFVFLKRREEVGIENNPAYRDWLKRISGSAEPELTIIDNTLCVEARGPRVTPAAPRQTEEAAKAPEAPVNAQTPAAAAQGPAQGGAMMDRIKNIIAEQTGYTTDMLEADLDMEADLGIDTVKQVEIFGKIAGYYGLDVPEDLKLRDLNTIARLRDYIRKMTGAAAPAAAAAGTAPDAAGTAAPAAGVDMAQMTASIQAVIADQTGYTVDMLETDLDMEADLGIDTVKQVEIFGKVAGRYGMDVPEDLKLRDLNTIAKLAEYVAKMTGHVAAPAAEASAAQVPAATAVAGGADAEGVVAAVRAVIADQTGYTEDMLEDDLDLEADLGIDTVKQVEIFGKISSRYGLNVPEDLSLRDLNTIAKLAAYISKMSGTAAAPAAASPQQTAAASPASPAAPDAASVIAAVKAVIGDQTGYTEDMLDDDLDLEADLGIDTVKQVEIFGKIASRYGLDVPEDLSLRDLNTIAKLAAYIAERADSGGDDTPPAGPAPGGSGPAKGETEAAAAAQAEAEAGNSLAAVSAAIKEIITEQTGYTDDMLEDGLDLEADLGIDSVKQVEIFGKIAGRYGLPVPEDLRLQDLNTIEKLAAHIGGKVGGAASPASETAPAAGGATQAMKAAPAAPAAPAASEAAASTASESDEGSTVKRLVIRPEKVKVPEGSAAKQRIEGRKLLVTMDSAGFGQSVIEKIEAMGGVAVAVEAAEIADAVKAAKLAEKLKAEHGDLTGLIHLSPLSGYFGKAGVDRKQADGDIKSLFTLIKALYPLLDGPHGLIAALSFDSVLFPFVEGASGAIHPAFAGVAGMLKTVNKEMKETLVKAVDFSFENPKEKAGEIAEQFLAELTSGCPLVETGYKGDDKYRLSLVVAEASRDKAAVRVGDTVLVTGGARGITYEILKTMVKETGCNVVILGRSDITEVAPEFLAPSADGMFILKKLKERMKGAKPLEIKRAVDRTLKLKETVVNIEQLKSMGVRAEYHAVDVADRAAVAGALSGYDRIDAVIHAAGIEESQFIEKKSMASFNRVFDTKVYGLQNLLTALEGKDYRFLSTFSSVTARFGNEGQIDYTCANDMIAKMVQGEKVKNPELICKIFDWTAWAGAGMATNATVKKVLEQRGIAFLPLEEGVRHFMDELSDGSETEVVISGLDYDFDVDGLLPLPEGAVDPARYPFLDRIAVEGEGMKGFSRLLSLERDLFLSDHAKDGVPIFLGATGIETMAEAACHLMGEERVLTEVSDFAIPYGIKILKGRPKEIEPKAVAVEGEAGRFDCEIGSQFKNAKGLAMGPRTLHYQGRYVFAKEAPKAAKITLPEFTEVAVEGDFGEMTYHPSRLFMDGVFRTIEGIASFDTKTLVTRMQNPAEGEFFEGVTKPEFVSDVVLLDAMFQTGGLIEFLTTSELVLPYRIAKMKIYARTAEKTEYYCITRKTAEGEETNTYQLELVDADGNLFIAIEDFEMVKLSRLEKADEIAHRVTPLVN